jgi:hypothetical protein
VQAGHTRLVQGTLEHRDFFYVDAGTGSLPGGVVEVLGSATNDGYVCLFGNATPGTAGAYGLVGPAGTLTNNEVIRIQGAHSSAPGVYGAAATVVVEGVLNNDDYFIGVGAALAPNGITGYLTGGSSTLAVMATGTIYNNSQIYLLSSNEQGSGVGGAVLDDAGLIVNTGYIGAYSSGSYTLSAGARIDIAGVFVNDRYLFLNSRAFSTTSISSSGYLDNAAGAYVVLQRDNVLDVSGRLYSTGELTFDPSSSVTVTGALTNLGDMVVAGDYGEYIRSPGSPSGAMVSVTGVLTNGVSSTHTGVMNVYGGSANQAYELLGGTVDLSGVLNNSGTVLLYGGRSYSGRYSQSGYGGGGALFVDSGTLANSGYLYVGVGSVGANTKESGTDAMLTVTSGGQLINDGVITGRGIVDNAGVILTRGDGTLWVGRLINDGTIGVASGGALSIGGAIAADTGAFGSLSIAAGGMLTIEGAVARDQTVHFAGAGGTLVLGDVAGFGGALAGLAVGDAVDFLGLDVSRAQASGAGLEMGLSNGATFDLALDAALTGVSLRLVHEGGGTELVVSAAARGLAQGLRNYVGAGLGHAVQSGSDGGLHLPA